ncbi:sugar epimerase [Egibacter rhizosphaerae]|uniref:Sugar epimerase n=1 Tax=Egibacter rhizosphaerae TaxID=1670831 RepID=A0A411YE26_9ACTN|nr:sugar phosphate isomerase/epimerase [Egibacter rhizosphaerae]QBI19503.1 sugar epimerase [Egibacter rhizosphaerae]
MTERTILVANAPVSYGAFELTVGREGTNVPGPEEVVASVAESGYDGIDLGPPGYLGDPGELRDRLARHGLLLAGAFVPMRFSEQPGYEDDLGGLGDAIGRLRDAADHGLARDPKVTLADAGDPTRQAHPGEGGTSRAPGLTRDTWQAAGARLDDAVDRCAAAGLASTFHHHAGTYVETADEIDALLDASRVSLCFDSGHLAMAGADVVVGFDRWRERINHLQLKDVREDRLRAALDEGGGMYEVWSRDIFCELGQGSLDLDTLCERIRAGGFEGWLMVEQDRIHGPEETIADASEAQGRNRRFLRERGF